MEDTEQLSKDALASDLKALLYSLNQGKCPDCNSEKFLAGPEGGLTQNIKCASCGSKFNYCPPCWAMKDGFAERI